jgi:hypothetical protein
VDVLPGYWAFDAIEILFETGITNGCSPTSYCPEADVTRAQMAKFLELSMHYPAAFTPPAVGASTGFADVPVAHWAAAWIKQLFADGVTNGCGTSPLIYCPENAVTRAQMAVFLLRAEHGAYYTPPVALGIFADVPSSNWAAAWIEQLYAEGITTGCSLAPLSYCPAAPVTRAEMAVFLVRTFDLP